MNISDKKYFIITIDTEGDGLWNYHSGNTIFTHNSAFLPRFQNVCNEYDFKPVYLTNYEMAKDPVFVKFARETLKEGKCEIGIHLHAWNTPPIYNLDNSKSDTPYLIEYPYEIMKNKFESLYGVLENTFGIKPVSHRAGRWAMNDDYFNLLKEYQIKVDCSHTPGVSWKKSIGAYGGGANYEREELKIKEINGVLEVPVTIVKLEGISELGVPRYLLSYLRECRKPYKTVWLRPSISSLRDMKKIIDRVNQDASLDYLEFMIHSSELMPGGSPYYPEEGSIENLYKVINELFDYIKNLGYTGCTLKEYYEKKQ